MMENPRPFGPYNFRLNAETIEEAALRALPTLFKVGFLGVTNDVCDAKIIGPGDQDYQILNNDEWLIDFNTGKRKGSLEERV